MLRTIKSILGHSIAATDGDLGKVFDVLFDDGSWRVRYVVADTGGWLGGRRVLLTPHDLKRPDWPSGRVPVDLTKEQVKNSPDLGSDPPVSLQNLAPLHAYYGWPLWWGAEYIPPPIPAEELQPRPGDPHLRAVREVSGYHIAATDGEMGHVEDFIMDADWTIRYLVAELKNWLPGRKVLISPQWIEAVRWAERDVKVSVPRAAIERSPEFNPSAPVNREYELRLYDYYGRPVYWGS